VYTGIIAGCLVAFYIYAEAPLSGMSMNPARSFASAALAQHWNHLWLYFAAPLLGMVGGAQLYRRVTAGRRLACAKLQHAAEVRCIHCGYQPAMTHGAHAHVN
jgi:aquaporin Z